MASYSRECRPRRALARSSGRDSCVQYVPVGLPPRSLLDQLVVDMQNHLEEMEKMRVVLVDAYPCLSTRRDGGRRRSRARRLGRRCLDDDDGEDDGEDDGTSNYQFALDVSGFEPEELSVKVEGRKLTVGAKHDKKSEGADGCVSHEFREVRKEIVLPADADLEALACNFSPESCCLRIEAPRLVPKSLEERTIPITILKAADAGAGSPPAAKDKSRPSSPEKGAAVPSEKGA